MRGSMSKKIVITFNIVADRVVNIAAKARTGSIIYRAAPAELMVAATSRFDTKVTPTGVIGLSTCPRAFRN